MPDELSKKPGMTDGFTRPIQLMCSAISRPRMPEGGSPEYVSPPYYI